MDAVFLFYEMRDDGMISYLTLNLLEVGRMLRPRNLEPDFSVQTADRRKRWGGIGYEETARSGQN